MSEVRQGVLAGVCTGCCAFRVYGTGGYCCRLKQDVVYQRLAECPLGQGGLESVTMPVSETTGDLARNAYNLTTGGRYEYDSGLTVEGKTHD